MTTAPAAAATAAAATKKIYFHRFVNAIESRDKVTQYLVHTPKYDGTNIISVLLVCHVGVGIHCSSVVLCTRLPMLQFLVVMSLGFISLLFVYPVISRPIIKL